MVGKVIGNYEVVEKIGEGGMGAVYRGLDTMLEREVAIKMLRPELSSQPQVVERFRTEAVTLAKLNHPNIATLYSFLRDGEDFFMVMEFVRGQTLDDMLRRFGAMIVERAVPLFCQALDGIDHAHRMGIIHRDIKPANMMLTEGGSIKVMDFGIARVLGSARLTRQGNVVGTIEYMSPEAVRGQEVDARSDVYSLGILLYEMLTGRVPFENHSEFEMMKAQVEQAPAPPRSFTASIPLEIEQAVMRALAKKPAARFQTAGEFRAALLGALGQTANLYQQTTNYAAPVTRQMQIPADGETLGLAADGDAIRGGTRMIGSPDEAVETHKRDTLGTAADSKAMPVAPERPQTGEQASTPTVIINQPGERKAPAPTEIISQPTGKTGPAPTVVIPTGNAPAAGAAVPNQPSAPAAASVRPAPAKGKLNWKHYTAAAVLLIVLIGAPLAYVMMRSARHTPVPEQTEPTAPDSSNPPTAPIESAAPTTNTNSNEAATSADVGTIDNANANTNANSNTSKNARARANRNENSNTSATPETAATPEQKPAQAEPPQPQPQQQTPAPDTHTASAPDANKNTAKPEEKKKGGFFHGIKKIFGGGGDDKKKDESKNKKP
jgi:eukaryotic-like serine/threonine-protein kinase